MSSSLRLASSFRVKRLTRAALLVSSLFVTFCRCASAGDVLEAIKREANTIFEHHKGAVVAIRASDKNGELAGSGFYMDPNGTIFTSYTIGGESWNIVVCQGDAKYPAERILGDPRSGIAILRVKARTPFLTEGNSSELSVASPVIVVGYPLDLSVTSNFGTVGEFTNGHICANLPVERGEGGAPLLNLKGEVVGVLISRSEREGECFALPIEAAEKAYHDFLRFGEVRPGWMGITVVNCPGGKGPVQVKDILDGSPATNSGLKKGDALLRVGGIKVNSAEDVVSASFYLTAGDHVPLIVLRDGKEITIQVEAGQPPAPSETRDVFTTLARARKDTDSLHGHQVPVGMGR